MLEEKTLAVVNRHGEAMDSKDPDIILKDYAEDAVVLCTLSDKPAVGHAQIRELIVKVLAMDLFAEGNGSQILYQKAVGERALHVFTNKPAITYGAETYIVRDDKIVFESAAIVLAE